MGRVQVLTLVGARDENNGHGGKGVMRFGLDELWCDTGLSRLDFVVAAGDG